MTFMSLVIEADPVPLSIDEDGVARIVGSRVTLDTIVTAFEQGETPESITDQYPGIAVEDVYAVVTYYLRHRSEVETYLAERNRQHEMARRENEKRFSQNGLRQRLLARRSDRH
jgi:uncharacterized protein (DUF433 family)